MITFTLPLLRLDTWTADGRLLEAPDSHGLKHRELPMSIFHRSAWDGGPDPLIRPGKVESLMVRDGLVVASGSLDDTPTGRELAHGITDGRLFLAPDVDQVKSVTEEDPIRFFQRATDGSVGVPSEYPDRRVRMISWRIAAVWLEDRPCWELPAGQVEYLAAP